MDKVQPGAFRSAASSRRPTIVDESSPTDRRVQFSNVDDIIPQPICQPCDNDPEIDKAPYKEGDVIKYSRDGRNETATIDSIKLIDDDLCHKYILRLDNGRTIESTHEFMSDINEEDPISIPREVEKYLKTSNALDEETLKKITSSRQLSPLETEFLEKHAMLQNIPNK